MTTMEEAGIACVRWPGIERTFEESLALRGAEGVRVHAWSEVMTPQIKHIVLDHPVFEWVDLTLEQAQMLVRHLPVGSNTERAFIVAQAIADYVDLDLVYDEATGKLKTPHARQKAVVA